MENEMKHSKYLFLLKRGYALYDKKTGTACCMHFKERAYDYEESSIYFTNGLWNKASSQDYAFCSYPPDIDIAGFVAIGSDGQKHFFTLFSTVKKGDCEFTVVSIVLNKDNPYLLCENSRGEVYDIFPQDLVLIKYNRDKNHADLLYRWDFYFPTKNKKSK